MAKGLAMPVLQHRTRSSARLRSQQAEHVLDAGRASQMLKKTADLHASSPAQHVSVKVETVSVKKETVSVKVEEVEKVGSNTEPETTFQEKRGPDPTGRSKRVKTEDGPVKMEPASPEKKSKVAYHSPNAAKLSDNFSFSRMQPNVFDLVDPKDVTPTQPKNWQHIYNEVVRMRARIFTPVDSMGCEKMAEAINPGVQAEEPRLFRFQILVSLMLSAQTKDEVNHRAIVKLQKHLQDKGYAQLCVEGVLSCTEAEVDSCIQQVGFHRRKAVYLKRASEMLRDRFGGDVPRTMDGILSLPGVGPKMGYLLLQIAWGITEGIGVDVHLHRLAVKWGWVRKSDKPEATRLELQSWLPRRYWADINPMLVGFGQAVCTPQASNCDICTLAAGLCKGVDRRMAALDMTPSRREKLLKSRGDVTGLVVLKMDPGSHIDE